MQTKTKILLACVIAGLLVLAAAFGGGLYQGYKIAMDKYRTDIAKVGESYAESERLNRQLTISNTDLKRINSESEQTIIGLKESLRLAGQGIGSIKDGNDEAKRLLRDLNDIIQSVESAQ